MSLFLSSSDWMILLQLIHRLHSIHSEDDVPVKSLELLNIVAPFRAGVFCRARQGESSLAITEICGHNIPAGELDVLKTALAANGFIQGVCLNPLGPVMRGPGQSQFTPKSLDAALMDIIPADMHQAITFSLHIGEKLVGFVVLWRGAGDDSFDQRDVCSLAYMKDHIALKLENLSPEVRGQKDTPDSLAAALAPHNLTKREIDVLVCIYQGMGEEETSEKLNISSSTYKKHLNHIYTKTQVSSKLKLMKLVEAALH